MQTDLMVISPTSLIIEDDGYLLAGSSGSPSLTDTDVAMALLKTDTTVVEQWHQDYQYGDLDDEGFAVCSTTDNGYLVTGWAQDNLHQIMIAG